jgi:hypothetical protein
MNWFRGAGSNSVFILRTEMVYVLSLNKATTSFAAVGDGHNVLKSHICLQGR